MGKFSRPHSVKNSFEKHISNSLLYKVACVVKNSVVKCLKNLRSVRWSVTLINVFFINDTELVSNYINLESISVIETAWLNYLRIINQDNSLC
jgi:hypothetical protein